MVQSTRSWWWSAAAAAVGVVLAPAVANAAAVPPFDVCYQQLTAANVDATVGELSPTEYGALVLAVSGGTVVMEQLDAAIYASGIAGGTTVFGVDAVRADTVNHVFCRALYTGILTTAIATTQPTIVDASDSNKCRLALTIGDANRDSFLEKFAEYPRFANQLSGNAYGFAAAFDAIPLAVQAIFDDFAAVGGVGPDSVSVVGSKSSETATDAQAAFFSSFCLNAGLAILRWAVAPTTTTSTTPAPFTPADVGGLTSAPTTIAPVAVATATTAASTTAAPVAATATAAPTTAAPLATTTTATATPTTAAPVAAATATAAPVVATTSTTPAPVSADLEALPAYTYDVCLRMIAFSDQSRDNALNSDEYYTFLNRLTTDAFAASGSYAALPAVLQTNFDTLSMSTGQINVVGSKPGQTATAEDTTRLTAVCTQTDVAIQSALGSSSGGGTMAPETAAPVAVGGSSTPAPVAAAAPGLPYDTCTKDMILADLSRDSYLDESEFVRFISRNNAQVQATDAFATLIQPLQDVFRVLSTNGVSIDVTGSKPNEVATPEQVAHLQSVCTQIGAALGAEGGGGGQGPVASPHSTGPVSGNIVIYNSFTLSNAFRILAVDLQQGPDRDSLNSAYASFILEVIANFTGIALPTGAITSIATAPSEASNSSIPETPTLRRQLRSRSKAIRRLPVTGSQADTAQIYLLRDSACPQNVVGDSTVCQTAFASFSATFLEMDLQVVSDQLTRYTQERINPWLSSKLVAVVPNTRIRIEGPSEPVQPGGGQSPDNPPPSYGGGSGPSVGGIIGGLVIGLFVLGGGGYFIYKRQVGGKSRSPDDGKEEIEFSTNEDRDGMIGHGVESAPIRSTPPSNIENDVDDSDDQSENDVDAGGVGFIKELANTAHDQQEKVQTFLTQKLRLGKKKNSFMEDDIGILESSDSFLEGGYDFVNYEFDVPCEMQQNDAKDRRLNDGLGENWIENDTDPDCGEKGWRATAPAPDTDFSLDDRTAEKDDSDIDRSIQSDSESSGSQSEYGKTSVTSAASGNIGKLGGLVDNGNWNGAIQSKAHNELDQHDSVTSAPLDEKSLDASDSATSFSEDDKEDSKREASDVNVPFDDRTIQTSTSLTSEDKRRRTAYRTQVEDLVRKTVPNEIGNIGTMMEQFSGREAELIITLQTIYERTASQRRLKSVHKSKAIPDRDIRAFASGGAEGSAVVAAASMITPESADEGSGYDDDGSFENEETQKSIVSGTGSFDDEEDEDGDDDEDSKDGSSYTGSQGGSFTGSHSGSYDENEGGSFTGSQRASISDNDNQSAKHDEHDEGSFTGSQSGSYDDNDNQEGSFTGSQSGSYDDNDNQEGSFTGSQGSHRASLSENDNKGENPTKNQSAKHVENEHDEGSFTGSQSGSYDDNDNQEGSFTGSQGSQRASLSENDNEGEILKENQNAKHDENEHDEGSFTGSQSGSYDDNDNQEGNFIGSQGSQRASLSENDNEGEILKENQSAKHDENEHDEGSFTGSQSGSYDDNDNQEGSFTGSQGSHRVSLSENDNDGEILKENQNAKHDENEHDEGTFTDSQSKIQEASFTGSQSGSFEDIDFLESFNDSRADSAIEQGESQSERNSNHPEAEGSDDNKIDETNHAGNKSSGLDVKDDDISQSASYEDDRSRGESVEDNESYTSGPQNKSDANEEAALTGAPSIEEQGSESGSHTGRFDEDEDEGSFTGSYSEGDDNEQKDDGNAEDQQSYTGSQTGNDDEQDGGGYANDLHSYTGSQTGNDDEQEDDGYADDQQSYTGSQTGSRNEEISERGSCSNDASD